jgi:two-component system, NtrC family, sensor kinase
VRLTAKFLFAFVLTSLLVLSASAAVRVRTEIAEFDDDMREDAAALVSSLARAVAAVAIGVGRDEALSVVTHADDRALHLTVRWVSLDHEDPGLATATAPADALEPLQHGELVFVDAPGTRSSPGALLAYARVDEPVPGLGWTAIEVTESLAARNEFVWASIQRTAITMLVAFSSCAAVALVFGLLLIGRPLGAIVGKVRRIATGDLATPLVLAQRDEIGEVAGELNAMCLRLAMGRAELEAATTARIAALEQLRHADRLATVGRLAAGIAHEVGTPLAVAGGRSKMIVAGEVTGDEIIESAQIVVEQTHRIAVIIRQLLDFARRSPAQRGRVDLVGVCRRLVTLLEPIAAKQRLTIVMIPPAEGSIYADVDAGQIQQALTNLVMNAVQATAAGGEVSVTISRGRVQAPVERGGGQRDVTSLQVSDTGAGMDPDTRLHVFDPFFTTKDIGEGTGLGLPVTHGLVHEHGGWIEVESELGRGSRFTIHLPLDEEGAAT